jgi:site-specific DNA recombinase
VADRRLRAAGYVRVSTDDQAEQGYSLDEQARMVQDAAGIRGWEWVRLYREAGVSGRRDDRPELARLLSELDSFDRLIVPAIDRLGRGSRHLLTVYDALENSSVGLVSLRESFDTSTPAGRFVRLILSGQAEMESEVIGERVKAAVAARARQGKPKGGQRPFGYRFDEGALIVVDTEAAIVRRIFGEFVGGRSQLAITRGLTTDRVPTVRGGSWHQGTVRRILANRVYAGMIVHNGTPYAGQHEPIIDDEMWTKAEALRHSRARTYGGGRWPAGRHLFRKGMLRCQCGAAMIPRTTPNRRDDPYEVYLCYGRHQEPASCGMPPLKRAVIDQAVFNYFEQVGLDVEATRRSLAEARNRKLAEVHALREEAEREADLAEQRLARVRRDYADGKLDATDWHSFRDELLGEQDATRAQADRLRDQQIEVEGWGELRDVERDTLQRLADIRAAIAGEVREAEGIDAVRAALARLFEHFIVHRDQPGRRHVELAFVDGLWIEPVVRPQAIVGYSESARPVLRREPLDQAANNCAIGLAT